MQQIGVMSVLWHWRSVAMAAVRCHVLNVTSVDSLVYRFVHFQYLRGISTTFQLIDRILQSRHEFAADPISKSADAVAEALADDAVGHVLRSR